MTGPSGVLRRPLLRVLAVGALPRPPLALPLPALLLLRHARWFWATFLLAGTLRDQMIRHPFNGTTREERCQGECRWQAGHHALHRPIPFWYAHIAAQPGLASASTAMRAVDLFLRQPECQEQKCVCPGVNRMTDSSASRVCSRY